MPEEPDPDDPDPDPPDPEPDPDPEDPEPDESDPDDPEEPEPAPEEPDPLSWTSPDACPWSRRTLIRVRPPGPSNRSSISSGAVRCSLMAKPGVGAALTRTRAPASTRTVTAPPTPR